MDEPTESPQEPEDRLPLVPEERDDSDAIVQRAFDYMRAGSTLNAAARECGVHPSSIWRWIHADENNMVLYDQLKTQRSRALMETALDLVMAANEPPDVKVAYTKAKLLMMQAAKLNPKEFSDRMHSPHGKGMGTGGRVSFTLNLGAPTSETRELTVIAQPEDGD